MSTAIKSINSIQALRAVAAGMIVLFHATYYLQTRNHIPDVPRLIDACRAGVDLFFVISGFIMTWISSEKFGVPGAPKDFIIRRIIRVVPAYWFYTILMAALAISLPHLVSQGKTVSIAHLLASLTFIPWENNIGHIKPVLSPGWTLNFEMYFYLIFGLILFLQKKYFLPLISLLLISGIVIGRTMDETPAIFEVATSPLLAEFLMGCVIATYYRRNTYINGGLLAFLLIAGIAALVATGFHATPYLPRPVKYGIPCAMIFTSIIYMEREGLLTTGSILKSLGDSSYSLYLSHLFTISTVGKIWFTVFGAMHIAFVVFTTIISIIVGHLAYLFFERPVTLRLNHIYKNNSQRSLQNRAGHTAQ